MLEFLAEQLRGNVRELEGALHALDHFARVTGRPISIELAREALAEVLRHCVRVVQIDDVERTIGSILGLDKGALRNSQRGWMYSHPRMLAAYLARKHTGATYTEIGHYFGGRSHSTAVAAEKKVRQWLKDDSALNLGQSRVRVQRCGGKDRARVVAIANLGEPSPVRGRIAQGIVEDWLALVKSKYGEEDHGGAFG